MSSLPSHKIVLSMPPLFHPLTKNGLGLEVTCIYQISRIISHTNKYIYQKYSTKIYNQNKIISN